LDERRATMGMDKTFKPKWIEQLVVSGW
jgi:hypothetical protein